MVMILVAVLLVAGLCGGAYARIIISPAMSSLGKNALTRVRADVVAHGSVYLLLPAIGGRLQRATLDVEDRRFYTHGVIDYSATARALLFDLRGGRPLQGGGTIEVQLAQRLLGNDVPDPVTRVLRVLVLADHLDRDYGKAGVLTLYLNSIYYGSGAYGAAAASRSFFHVVPRDLTLSQAAFLAGLPNAPAIYGDHPTSVRTRQRWNIVVRAMARAGDMTGQEEEQILRAGAPLLPRIG